MAHEKCASSRCTPRRFLGWNVEEVQDRLAWRRRIRSGCVGAVAAVTSAHALRIGHAVGRYAEHQVNAVVDVTTNCSDGCRARRSLAHVRSDAPVSTPTALDLFANRVVRRWPSTARKWPTGPRHRVGLAAEPHVLGVLVVRRDAAAGCGCIPMPNRGACGHRSRLACRLDFTGFGPWALCLVALALARALELDVVAFAVGVG